MFANLLKDVEGIDIWVSFSANENNQWRVEFRSKEIPVNLVASKWGGGGHKLASGAIINNLEEAKNVIQDLQNLIS
jgi:phosphoesterase RecJ-like protein